MIEIPSVKPKPSRPWVVYHLRLKDQIPNIGTGFRRVEAQVGRKWAKVRVKGFQANRISRKLWDEIPKQTPNELHEHRGRNHMIADGRTVLTKVVSRRGR